MLLAPPQSSKHKDIFILLRSITNIHYIACVTHFSDIPNNEYAYYPYRNNLNIAKNMLSLRILSNLNSLLINDAVIINIKSCDNFNIHADYILILTNVKLV